MLRTNKNKEEKREAISEREMNNLYSLLYACRLNAYNLLYESKILYNHNCFQRAFFLAYTANEEISKGQIIADFILEVASKSELKSAFKNHDIKAAYGKLKIKVGSLINSGKATDLEDKEPRTYTFDSTLEYDVEEAKEMFVVRNKSLYVHHEDDFSPIEPSDIFDEAQARALIEKVKSRFDSIQFAEDFNGIIGTKALLK